MSGNLRTITMSNASQLLATADKAKRRDEFMAFLTEWGQQAQADDQRRSGCIVPRGMSRRLPRPSGIRGAG